MLTGYLIALVLGAVIGYCVASILTLNALNRMEADLDALLEAYEEAEKNRDGGTWQIED